MTKLDHKQVLTAYVGATVAAVSTSMVGAYLWDHLGGNSDYGLIVSSTWLVTVGAPSLLVSMDTLRKTLGEKQQNTVRAVGHHGRRAIPWKSGSKSGHVFLSVLPWVNGSDPDPQHGPVELPPIFTSTIDGIDRSLTMPEIEDFLRGAWRKQRIGEAGLSRSYWTKRHRPRLKQLEYQSRLNILLSCDGLILDRSQRRSGRLAVSPGLAMKALQGLFELV